MEWMNNFYFKKIYVEVLHCIKNHQQRFAGQNYPQPWESLSLIDQSIKNLCGADYLKMQENCSNIFITKKGANVLEKYFQFTLKGDLAKFTKIFKG